MVTLIAFSVDTCGCGGILVAFIVLPPFRWDLELTLPDAPVRPLCVVLIFHIIL
jgi:hypothetical protein